MNIFFISQNSYQENAFMTIKAMLMSKKYQVGISMKCM